MPGPTNVHRTQRSPIPRNLVPRGSLRKVQCLTVVPPTRQKRCSARCIQTAGFLPSTPCRFPTNLASHFLHTLLKSPSCQHRPQPSLPMQVKRPTYMHSCQIDRHLTEQLQHLLSQALSGTTQSTYAAGVRQYLRFCNNPTSQQWHFPGCSCKHRARSLPSPRHMALRVVGRKHTGIRPVQPLTTPVQRTVLHGVVTSTAEAGQENT